MRKLIFKKGKIICPDCQKHNFLYVWWYYTCCLNCKEVYENPYNMYDKPERYIVTLQK